MTTGVQPMSTLWQPTATHYRAHTWCARLLYQGQVLILHYCGIATFSMAPEDHLATATRQLCLLPKTWPRSPARPLSSAATRTCDRRYGQAVGVLLPNLHPFMFSHEEPFPPEFGRARGRAYRRSPELGSPLAILDRPEASLARDHRNLRKPLHQY